MELVKGCDEEMQSEDGMQGCEDMDFAAVEVHHKYGAGIAQLVVLGLAVHSVAGSILLWGHFPVEGIFPLELTWVQTPFPKNSFG